MAEPRKSALFVDYDSIYRSLKAASKDASERLAQRATTWVAAIESGRLFTARSEEAVRRRVLIRRCYADPRVLGKNRPAFTSAGFEVIDCPPLESRDRGSADIHMVLDTMDALEHPTGYDEFILLSADADLTPVLLRLRAHNRATAIYATDATPAPYRAIPDAVVEEAPLLQLLSVEDARSLALAPQPQPASAAPEKPGRPAAPPVAAGDRGDIEVLARKVHNATAVPLFSPRTFADLFRVLAQEIAENGYHFQSTAENVAGKLAAAGRNVTRRQVVFVVKGLALKGHVFSTTDTSERLAEVFREQVIYLIGNNGLALDSSEQALLASWIVGRVPTATATATAVETQPEPEPKPIEEPKAPKKRATKAPAPAAKPAPQKAVAPPPAPAVPPVPVAAATARPVQAPSSVQPSRSIEEIKAAVAARAAAMRSNAAVPRAVPPPRAPAPAAPQRQPALPPSRPAPPPAPARAATVDYSRPTQVARPPAPPPRPQASRQAPPPPAAPRPAPAAQRPPAASAEASKQALESSILAAIAQAVDVLVEDGTTPTVPEPDQALAPSLTSPTPEPIPEPEAVSGDAEGGDIGDEIQRIIASYSRARQQGEPH